MQGDAISSGFACISRRFSAGLLAASQGKSTQKCSSRRRKCISPNLETHSRVLRKQYDFRPFQSHVPALPVHVDSHKGRACPPDWESIPASQEIRVVRREFPRSLSSRGKSSDFSRQAHAFMRWPCRGSGAGSWSRAAPPPEGPARCPAGRATGISANARAVSAS